MVPVNNPDNENQSEAQPDGEPEASTHRSQPSTSSLTPLDNSNNPELANDNSMDNSPEELDPTSTA